MVPVGRVSLLDTVGLSPARFLLVYTPANSLSPWWVRPFDSKLSHVDVWKDLGQGFYLVLSPFHDYLSFELVEGEPQGIVQPVTAMRRQGTAMFPFGFKTCVSVAKATLGIKDIRVQTSRQLFRYVQQHRGVV